MTKTLNIRGVDPYIHRRFAAGATLRSVSQGEYLAALINFREAICNLTDEMLEWENAESWPPTQGSPMTPVEELLYRLQCTVQASGMWSLRQ